MSGGTAVGGVGRLCIITYATISRPILQEDLDKSDKDGRSKYAGHG